MYIEQNTLKDPVHLFLHFIYYVVVFQMKKIKINQTKSSGLASKLATRSYRERFLKVPYCRKREFNVLEYEAGLGAV